MEKNYFSSISKQKHILQTDDYWEPKRVPEGYIVKRTNESGFGALMCDSPNEPNYDRFETSAQHFHDKKPLELQSIDSSNTGVIQPVM